MPSLAKRLDLIDNFLEDSIACDTPSLKDIDESLLGGAEHSTGSSPTPDVFGPDDSQPLDRNGPVDVDCDSGVDSKPFMRPFPPSHATNYGIRLPYRSNDSGDIINPHSPSVSVHIVNVPSPLALQQTR